jgi:hypothetical protein
VEPGDSVMEAAAEETEELRGAISIMDARLSEFLRKDADVYSRIKEAMEQAEEAKLGREALEGREGLLVREVRLIRQMTLVEWVPRRAIIPSRGPGNTAACRIRTRASGGSLGTCSISSRRGSSRSRRFVRAR